MRNGIPVPVPTWRRILVVDDDPDVTTLVSLSLGRLPDCTVETCHSSQDALARARSFQPELILLDVMMPLMDGPQTLQALRADPATSSIPVIFISAGLDRHDTSPGDSFGAVGIIPKPFDPVRLPSTLADIWRGEAVKPAFPAPLENLREDFMSDLRDKVDAMTSLARSLVARGWDKGTTQSLLEMAHRMAGSSGLYGLEDLSRASGVLEGMLKRALDAPRWPPARSPGDVATLVKALARHAPRARRRRRPPHVAT